MKRKSSDPLSNDPKKRKISTPLDDNIDLMDKVNSSLDTKKFDTEINSHKKQIQIFKDKKNEHIDNYYYECLKNGSIKFLITSDDTDADESDCMEEHKGLTFNKVEFDISYLIYFTGDNVDEKCIDFYKIEGVSLCKGYENKTKYFTVGKDITYKKFLKSFKPNDSEYTNMGPEIVEDINSKEYDISDHKMDEGSGTVFEGTMKREYYIIDKIVQ
jgi:hypothetical protein